MSNTSIPSTFLKTVLQNGVGRYVCQLKRMTIYFCKEHGNSLGARDYLENDLIDFTRANPGVAVYAQLRPRRPPQLHAEYLNGKSHTISLSCKAREELVEWADFMRTRSGEDLLRVRKRQHTHTPTIQGTWTPITNRPSELNHVTFPDANLSRCHQFKKTTTELVLENAEDSGNSSENNSS